MSYVLILRGVRASSSQSSDQYSLSIVPSFVFCKNPWVSVLFIGYRLLSIGFVRLNDETLPRAKLNYVLNIEYYKLLELRAVS